MKSLLATLLISTVVLAGGSPDGGALIIVWTAPITDPTGLQVNTLAVALDGGVVPVATVFKKLRPDGGTVWVSSYFKEDAGGQQYIYLDDTPCAWRPLDGGTNCLQADGGVAPTGQTLQSGQWSGAGCRKKACVILQGDHTEGL